MNSNFFTSILIFSIVGSVFSVGYNNFDQMQSIKTMKQNQQTKIQSPQTVQFVDLDKYLGVWYEIASIPAVFQRGCTKSMAKYSWNTDKKSIKVENSCVRNNKLSKIIGKATPLDDTNAKLQFEFQEIPNSKSQYWIIRLGKDYQYAVVCTIGDNYLWILYRDTQMPQDLYDSIIDDLKQDNFPVQKLKRTKQNNQNIL